MQKHGKKIKVDDNIDYLSDLDYEMPRKDINPEITNKRKPGKKLDMVDKKHRMKLTEAEISRILNECKTLP